MDANSFGLVSWYFDIWNLFLLVLHLNVAFAVWFERIAPTASDAVGDVMVWIAIRWEKCLLGFPRNPLFVFWDSCLFSLLRMMINQQSHEILSSVLEQKDHWEKLMSDGGEITKTRFGYFSRLLVCFRVLVSRLETIYEDRFYLKLWNPKLTYKVWESSFRNEAVCQSCGFKVFTRS